jgi:NAD(P)H-dependent FMN reductase
MDETQSNDTPTVALVCGSQRAGSVTQIALGHVADGVRDAGGRVDRIDLGAMDLPTFDPYEGDAGDADRLRQRLRDADAVVLGTPMYHGSFSGTLKNALDYCGFEAFEGTTVGLLSVAGGGYPRTPIDHLTDVCRTLNAWVVPETVMVPHSETAAENGVLTDDALRQRAERLGRRVVDTHDADADGSEMRSRGV